MRMCNRSAQHHSPSWLLVLFTVNCYWYTGLKPWRIELKSSSLLLLSLPLTCLRLVCIPGSEVVTRNRVQTCDSNGIASLNSRVHRNWNREMNWIHQGLAFRAEKCTDWSLTTVYYLRGLSECPRCAGPKDRRGDRQHDHAPGGEHVFNHFDAPHLCVLRPIEYSKRVLFVYMCTV